MRTHQTNDSPSCFQHDLVELDTIAKPYYVELTLEALDEQGRVLDSVIHFTFDMLNVQHLDLRIVADVHSLRTRQRIVSNREEHEDYLFLALFALFAVKKTGCYFLTNP